MALRQRGCNETNIYPRRRARRSTDLQSMMFVPFSKDFCGDQYLYLLFIPTLVKILQSHCSLPPTTSSKSGFFLTPAMLTNTTSYLIRQSLLDQTAVVHSSSCCVCGQLATQFLSVASFHWLSSTERPASAIYTRDRCGGNESVVDLQCSVMTASLIII